MMKHLPDSVKSILAGLVTASVFLLVWLFPGCGAYAIGRGWCTLAVDGSLAYHQALLVLAVALLVSGAVVSSGRKAGENRQKRRIKVYIAGAVALAFVFVHGVQVRTQVRKFEQVIPGIRKDISTNLVVMSKKRNWIPTFSGFLWPKLTGVWCGDCLAGRRVSIDLNDAGEIQSARLSILESANTDTSREEMIGMLRSGNDPVCKPMLAHLEGHGGCWDAETGKYSLTYTDY